MTEDFSAGEANIIIDSGDDETIVLTREDSSGNTKDITDYEFWFTVKDDYSQSDTNAVIQKNVTAHTDPTNGETEFSLVPADTADLSGSYRFDIQEETNSGTVNTLVAGRFIVKTDVTEA
jgi:hypothetical protein